MTDFDDLLVSEAVAFGVKASSKAELFGEIAARAAKVSGRDANMLRAQLFDRERLGTTGFGDGVALPHGRLANLDFPFGIFMTLEEAVDYDSVDGMPVDCVFALFSSEDDGASHLQSLARVSRRFRDAEFVAKLRGARSADALFALMTSYEAADAA